MDDGLTEAEAKKRWCPFARAHWSGNSGQDTYQGNRFFAEDGKTSDPATGCLGSGCMAWRWAGNDGDWRRRTGGILTPTPVGFCGFSEPRIAAIKEEKE